MQITFNPKLFSPLHWHLMPLLRDPAIRFIFIEGGSSAAKTFEICRGLLLDCLQHHYSVLVFRRFQVDITDSVYSSFKAGARSLEIDEFFTFQQHVIKLNEADNRIRFRGLDDDENIKGIEDFNIVYNNEWSQFTEAQWSQQRKRLRGKPNQKFICDWNPISSKLWQYEQWLDKDSWTELPLTIAGAPTKYCGLNPEFSFKRINKKGNAVWIKVTYRDNFWIVGHPSGKGGYVDQATIDDFEYDRIHKPNFYRIYANGERGIMRTGGEFFKQFDETRHVKPVKIDSETTLHVSCDENVNPYVTLSVWQVKGKDISQVNEFACKTPDNNAVKAAKKLSGWLKAIAYKDSLFVYGDPSASKRSTVDPNSRSFYDRFIATLKEEGFSITNRVQRSAPEVSLSKDFINDIYEHNYGGYSISIGDNCRISVDDYATVKEDADGKMQKQKVKDPDTGVTYEPNGHFSDAKRYFITTVLANEFERYKSRGKRRGSTAVNE